MKHRFLIFVCVALCASAASAQVDTRDNGIGIYADLDGLSNQVCLTAGEPLEVYLLMTRPTGTRGFAGWECRVVVPDNVTIWGWNLPIDGSVCVSSPPSFCVGLPGIPYQTVMHLATFILTPLNGRPATFYIEEFPNNQGVTEPRYFDYNGTDDGEMVDMVAYCPWSGSEAAFTINPEILPVSNPSWGEMKALFR